MNKIAIPKNRLFIISRGSHRNIITGFTLFEVLVTLIVLAIGLLGLASLQAYSLRNNHSSYFRSQANTMAYEIIDLLRANRQNALQENYNIALNDEIPTGSSIMDIDRKAWLEKIAVTLPLGKGAISCSKNTSICVVTIQWDDSRGTKGSSVQTFTMTTQL